MCSAPVSRPQLKQFLILSRLSTPILSKPTTEQPPHPTRLLSPASRPLPSRHRSVVPLRLLRLLLLLLRLVLRRLVGLPTRLMLVLRSAVVDSVSRSHRRRLVAACRAARPPTRSANLLHRLLALLALASARLRVAVVVALAAVGSVLSVTVQRVRAGFPLLLHRLVAGLGRSLSQQRLVEADSVHWLAVLPVEVLLVGLEVEELRPVVLAALALQHSRVVEEVVGVLGTTAGSHCHNPRVSALTPADSAGEC